MSASFKCLFQCSGSFTCSVTVLLPQHTSASTSGRRHRGNLPIPLLFRMHRNPSGNCQDTAHQKPKSSPSKAILACAEENKRCQGAHAHQQPHFSPFLPCCYKLALVGMQMHPVRAHPSAPPRGAVLTLSRTQLCAHSAPKSCPAQPPCDSDDPSAAASLNTPRRPPQ